MFYEWEGFFLTLYKEILTSSIIVLFITFTPHMAYIYNHGKFLSFSIFVFFKVLNEYYLITYQKYIPAILDKSDFCMLSIFNP